VIEKLVVSLVVFIFYILIAGGISTYDIVTGLLVSIVTGWATASYLVKNPEKLRQPGRLLILLLYFLKYITIIEFKAHMDVVKRIFNMDIKPGIVKIPVTASSSYARLLVANSITNTPGTVVVDEKDGFFYVNWIYVSATDPWTARSSISQEFEKYASRIFD